MNVVTTGERRAAERHRSGVHRIVTSRIRPGHGARVIDISTTGILLDTPLRLLPGSTVDIHIATHRHHVSIRGQVVRCTVLHVRPVICYRGAIAFERPIDLQRDRDGYHVPTSAVIRGRSEGEGTTREIQ